MAIQTNKQKISSITFGKRYSAKELAELGTVKVINYSGYDKPFYRLTLENQDFDFVKSRGNTFKLEYITNSTYNPRLD